MPIDREKYGARRKWVANPILVVEIFGTRMDIFAHMFRLIPLNRATQAPTFVPIDWHNPKS